MITVVDYGMGNLRNVRRAFEELAQEVTVTSDPTVIAGAEQLVLTGVGAFGEAVKRIDSLGLRAPILLHARAGKMLLGICLGMQLLFDASEESPGVTGLGLLPGAVKRFRGDVKVPHIGWNDATACARSPLFDEVGQGGCYYFVHSYYVPAGQSMIAATEYGIEFASAVQRENVFGVQFHPEKSQDVGHALLKRFLGTRRQPA